MNVDKYPDTLLNGGKHIHKDDIKRLTVKEATLIKKDGTPGKKFKGIMRKVPPIKSYIKGIAESLNKKNEKRSLMNGELHHINLILYDTENLFRTWSSGKVTFHLFRNRRILKIIKESKYKEIFFITNINDNDVYIPLKLNLFVRELFYLQFVLDKYYKTKFSVLGFLHISSFYFHEKYNIEVTIFERESEYEFLIETVGVIISDSKHISIVNYGEFSPNLIGDKLTFKFEISYKELKRKMSKAFNAYSHDILITYPVRN